MDDSVVCETVNGLVEVPSRVSIMHFKISHVLLICICNIQLQRNSKRLFCADVATNLATTICGSDK